MLYCSHCGDISNTAPEYREGGFCDHCKTGRKWVDERPPFIPNYDGEPGARKPLNLSTVKGWET